MREPRPWSSAAAIASLERSPFGVELARRLAAELRRQGSRPNRACAGLYNRHRDYCGHGLVFSDGRFHLLAVHDGIADVGRSLARWDDDASFVEFWAAQSDFTCSGADAHSRTFHTDDEWNLNNQRITRGRIAKFVDVALCPYCGGVLRSAKAKQCGECLQDWHDPTDVKPIA